MCTSLTNHRKTSAMNVKNPGFGERMDKKYLKFTGIRPIWNIGGGAV